MLLRQLNEWFPGEFRAIADAPLYEHGETTVVQATHKVGAMPDWAKGMRGFDLQFCSVMCSLQAKWP